MYGIFVPCEWVGQLPRLGGFWPGTSLQLQPQSINILGFHRIFHRISQNHSLNHRPVYCLITKSAFAINYVFLSQLNYTLIIGLKTKFCSWLGCLRSFPMSPSLQEDNLSPILRHLRPALQLLRAQLEAVWGGDLGVDPPIASMIFPAIIVVI